MGGSSSSSYPACDGAGGFDCDCQKYDYCSSLETWKSAGFMGWGSDSACVCADTLAHKSQLQNAAIEMSRDKGWSNDWQRSDGVWTWPRADYAPRSSCCEGWSKGEEVAVKTIDGITYRMFD
eukprot:TRINITY_DN104993_c0_g1_i1.p1 TRINITY_DN104993_c0_g1~~TRINITY_DN104993_c0_g1_i1.p1  ORF type:complete len:122 (-),score=4.82 TRINITY_DN104993_c0_g1_i1:183-548(-)